MGNILPDHAWNQTINKVHMYSNKLRENVFQFAGYRGIATPASDFIALNAVLLWEDNQGVVYHMMTSPPVVQQI